MAVPKQKLREALFQLLYSYSVGNPKPEDMVPLLMKQLSIPKSAAKQVVEKADHILAKIPEIDPMIEKTSTSYAFERIHTVQKNVLRLGIYELLFDESIPEKVAITEAMRLSKKFGTPASAGFVNAILDAIFKMSKGEQVDKETLEESAEKLKEEEEKNE